MWMPATIKWTTKTSHQDSVNYNSEWNKFVLLMWKNYHIMVNVGGRLFLSIISPLTICVVVIALHITSDNFIVAPTKTYEPVNLITQWKNLINILEERKAILSKNSNGFSYNCFVPRMVIGYAPNTLAFKDIMARSKESFHPMEIKEFDNCDDLQKGFIEESLFCGVCFGVGKQDNDKVEENKFVDGLYPYHFKLQLIFPAYLRHYNDTYIGNGWHTQSLYVVEYPLALHIFDLDGDGYIGYAREGFCHIQNTIISSYLKAVIEAKKSNFEIPQLTLNRLPDDVYQRGEILENFGDGLPFLLVMCNIYTILMLVSRIVEEKDNKSKALTKVLGVRCYLHLLSWLVESIALSLVSTFTTTVLLKAVGGRNETGRQIDSYMDLTSANVREFTTVRKARFNFYQKKRLNNRPLYEFTINRYKSKIKWCFGTAVFNNINFLCLLVIICVYNLSGVCFCLMLSSCFKRTITSVMNFTFIWFLTFIPFMISLTDFQYGKSTLGLISMAIFHNTTFGYLIQSIITYEQYGNAFATLEIFQARDRQTGLTISMYVFILLLQSLIYIAITLYIEEACPGRYNFKRRLKFFHLNRKTNHTENISRRTFGYSDKILKPESLVYEIAATSPVVVDISKVTKKYGNQEVVKNVSLQLRKNEITILIGHNGSGKTTLVSMICGLISPTTGSISIDGFDVDKDKEFACASLGISLQTIPLYANLTVRNQLFFFGYLKGLSGTFIQKEVDKYIQAAKLLYMENVLTKDLHISPKQELAVCCALIGRSRIVILDEPNAHLDEIARMRSWELITKEKFGRTILITASNPDILEPLGDSVAILAHGELQCVGSPAFVKQMYGKGYRLVCTKGPNCNLESLSDFLRVYIPSIILASEIGNKIVYILDQKYTEIFDELSRDLERNSEFLDITNFSLRRMNLDDIYIKMGSLNPAHENWSRLIDILNGKSIYPEEDDNLKFIVIKNRLTGWKLLFQQIHATIIYHFKILRHHKTYLFKKILLPPLLTFLAFQISFFSKTLKKPPPIHYHLQQYTESVIILETNPHLGSHIREIAENYGQIVFWQGIMSAIKKIHGVGIEGYFLKKQDKWSVNTVYQLAVTFFKDRINCWFNNKGLHTVPLTLNLVHNAIQRSILGADSSIQISLHPTSDDVVQTDAQIRTTISTGTLLGICITMAAAFVVCGRTYFITKDYKTGMNNITACAGSNFGIMSMTSAFAELIFILFMTLGIIVTIMIFQKQIQHPFSLYVWYFVVIVVSSFCMYSFNSLIAEFFHDPIHAFIIAISLACFSIVIYSHYSESTEDDYTSRTKQPGSMYFLGLPHFAMCNAISTIYFSAEFKRVCKNSEIRIVSITLEKCKLAPNCCNDYDILDANTGVLYELIAFIVIISLSWLIIFLKQKKRFWTCLRFPRDDYFARLNEHKFRHDNNGSDFSQREIVMELYKIRHMRIGDLPEYGLICNRLGKYYRGKVGVERIILTIPRGEAYGIMGESGCGKTTLFDLIAGSQQLSYGRVYVGGVSSIKEYYKYQFLTGYGVQNISPYDEITIRDLLEFLCRLHGYPLGSVDGLCINLAKVLGFYQHYNKKLIMISEGTRKMLLCAVALLGNRPLIIFDMLSDSIDSSGRLKLLRLLEKLLANGTTIIYACNSFDEIERFCKRIGLISHGSLCVSAPPMELDKLYSKYYLLRIKFHINIYRARDDSYNRYIYVGCFNKLCKFLLHQFPNTKFESEIGHYMDFLIPFATSSMWNTFSIMQANTYFLNIEDFELTHTFYKSFQKLTQIKRYIVNDLNRS